MILSCTQAVGTDTNAIRWTLSSCVASALRFTGIVEMFTVALTIRMDSRTVIRTRNVALIDVRTEQKITVAVAFAIGIPASRIHGTLEAAAMSFAEKSVRTLAIRIRSGTVVGTADTGIRFVDILERLIAHTIRIFSGAFGWTSVTPIEVDYVRSVVFALTVGIDTDTLERTFVAKVTRFVVGSVAFAHTIRMNAGTSERTVQNGIGGATVTESIGR